VSVLVLLHIGLFTLYFSPAPQDPFNKTANVNLITAYGTLPVVGHVRGKFHHALNHPPYAVGLFGNSRIVMVGHEDLGMQAGEMFNFAVGGTSFLQSVSLLAELAKAGKAPDVSIISLDHPEMQFFGYSYWPEPLSKIMKIADDAKLFYARTNGDDRPTIDTLKIFKNSIEHAWARTKELWSFDVVRRYLNFLSVATGFAEKQPGKVEYQSDGSTLAQPVLTRSLVEFSANRALSKMSNRYLENAIIRLSRLVSEYGLKVVVYESPIAPEIERRLREAASSYAQATQQRTFSMCVQEGLDCRAAPVIEPPKDGPFWRDCCHAPPGQLGRFVRTLINDVRHPKPNAFQ